MTAPWYFSLAPLPARIWKNSTASAPCATACQLHSRITPGRFTGLTSRHAVVLGVCSISQNGAPPLSPRIRSCQSAIHSGSVSSGG
jgi:hypothetical protein